MRGKHLHIYGIYKYLFAQCYDMKEKTRRKLLKRWQAMPLHHINTEVMIESLKDTKLGRACIQYLNRVGHKYRAALSLSVLGEFFMVTYRDAERLDERQWIFDFLDRFIHRSKVEFATARFDTYKLISEIRKVESRIEETDALHLAIAIQHKADAFVAFDEVLLKGKKELEKAFRIRVIHPQSL